MEVKLSKRELQVLVLMANDMETGQIAEAMLNSPRTIETIRARIKKKARVKTLPGLILWGIRSGYLNELNV